jgi:uncharacterized caspase-like protein
MPSRRQTAPDRAMTGISRAGAWGLAMIMALAVFASDAFAERRLALVIGNGGYTVGPLDNPANDAALMAETLRLAGFEVTHHVDLGYRDMQRAVVQFGRDLRGSGNDTVGMVYYAGHAIQSDGENYLIPVDADIQDELDLRIATLDVSTLMTSLDKAGNRLNMVILDACRNNPFKSVSRSGSRGLAKIDAASGTLLAFSTAPGRVAADGTGRNSPYTAALAKAIRTPGLPVEQVFKRVRIDVMERTGEQQVPWESSSLTGDFMFLEPAPVVAAPAPAPAPTEPDNSAEIQFWTSIAGQDDPALLRSYLEAYPNGLFVALAQQRIATLESAERESSRLARDAEARDYWNAVKDTGDPALLRSVIDRYGDTVYAELAQVKIESVTARSAGPAPAAAEPDNAAELLFWESIKNSSNRGDYQAYLDRYPDGAFATIARGRAENGFTPSVAALPPTGGPVKYVGTLESVGTCYGGGAWCRPGNVFEAEVEVDGKSVRIAFKGHGTSLTLSTSIRDGGAFFVSRNIAGSGGSGAFFFKGKVLDDVVTYEVTREAMTILRGKSSRTATR